MSLACGCGDCARSFFRAERGVGGCRAVTRATERGGKVSDFGAFRCSRDRSGGDSWESAAHTGAISQLAFSRLHSAVESPPHFEWPHAAGCFRSHGRASSLHKAALSLAMVLDLTCVGVVVPISLLFCLNRPLRRPTSISLRPPPTRQKPARASGASEVKVTTRTSGMGHDEPHYKARRPGGLASRRIARSRVLGPVL